MRLDEIPERVLQRSVHEVLSNSSRRWRATNGEYLQFLAPGTINPHEGPDFLQAAVLQGGSVRVADCEFHVRSSSWRMHGHHIDARYRDVAVHIVLIDDEPVAAIPWTLALPASDVLKHLRPRSNPIAPDHHDVDELQRAAFIRLKRHTDQARPLIARLGEREALRAMTDLWFERMSKRKSHLMSNNLQLHTRAHIADSPLGGLFRNMQGMQSEQLLDTLRVTEQMRISVEGRSMRREILMNVVFPCCCAVASNQQLIVLLQWYWSVPSIHQYAALRRRFPEHDQSYIWQQQGLLEYARLYAPEHV